MIIMCWRVHFRRETSVASFMPQLADKEIQHEVHMSVNVLVMREGYKLNNCSVSFSYFLCVCVFATSDQT